jgi:hypothetical protein
MKHHELKKQWDSMMQEYQENFTPRGWTMREFDAWKYRLIDLQLEILKAMEEQHERI